MDIIKSAFDFFMHLDQQHLYQMIADYDWSIVDYDRWIYLILFLIIFVETGLVVVPFLPGDSLLFAAGTFCAGVVSATGDVEKLHLGVVLALLSIAAILGDSLNYYLGKNIGLKVLHWKIAGKSLVKEEYIDKTHAFFEKNGPKTVIIARFVPIVRTFAPFVAGIGSMRYQIFIQNNIIGALLWVCGLTLVGYFFGNIPIVQKNFEIVILTIVGLSVLPVLFGMIKSKVSKSA